MWTVEQLLHGDCLDLLRSIPDNSVDAVVTDPPYGTTEEGVAKLVGFRSGEWRAFGEDWDRQLPLDWIKKAVRVLRPGGSFIAFTDTKSTGDVWDALGGAGARPLQCLFWRKTNPPTNPRKNFCSAIEAAVFARKPGNVIWWGGGGSTHNVFECPVTAGCHKQHPTQKPITLMRWLVRLVTPPGGTVLDPFAGSGSTLVAARREGFGFVGIEREQEYIDIARRRLEATALPLFARSIEKGAG